jgi:hypothetical protein
MFDLTTNGKTITIQDDDIVVRGSLMIDSKGKKTELGPRFEICSLTPIRIYVELETRDKR